MTLTNTEPQPVIPFDEYSSFDKLINVTVNIFKIRNKLNHVDQDLSNSVKIYLLKVMQQQSFASEFAHLHPPKGKKVPELVKTIEFIYRSEEDDLE